MNSASNQKEILAELAGGLTHSVDTPATYLEIGVQEGKSLRVVVENGPFLMRLVLCDTWGRRSGGTNRGNHVHVERLLKELDYTGSVEFLDGDSIELVPKLGVEQFDLVHVDGDHSYEHCLADLMNGWARCIRVLVAHDASFEGVRRALFEFGKKYAAEIAQTTLAFGGHGTMIFRRAL